MKKIRLILMLLLTAGSIMLSSCKDDDKGEDPVQKEITLNVSGNNGEVITVNGTDVVMNITIAASEAVDRDIALNIVTDAADGSAVLEAATATIAKGTDKAVVKITFPASKFPQGTAEKAIKVTVTASDPNVALSPAFTTFNVKGENGASAPANLTFTSDKLEINTTDADGVAVINFTLSKALDKDIEIVGTYGNAEDFVGTEGVVWNPYPVKIKKGETTLQLTITVPQGRTGSMPIVFSCANSDVSVQTTDITFTFVETSIPNPNPEASISTAGGLTVNVDGADVTRTLEIKLSKEAAEAVTVDLTVASENTLTGTLSKQSVAFPVGETTQTVDITFAGTDFIGGTSATVTVTITSSDVDVKASASSLAFNVSGPKSKQNGNVTVTWYRDETDWVEAESNSTITFTAEEIAQGYLQITACGNSDIDLNASFILKTEGLEDGDIEGLSYPNDKLIYVDSNYGYYKFKVKTSAIGKTATFQFVSDDTTFAPDQELVNVTFAQ